MEKQKKEAPIMEMGKYEGLRIDQIPNSYLRWMIGQDFPKEWKDIAMDKIGKSQFDNTVIDISRHALDMFSLRYLSIWQSQSEVSNVGLATFVAHLAVLAYERGTDISKNRSKDDGKILSYEGIDYVFSRNDTLITLITIM